MNARLVPLIALGLTACVSLEDPPVPGSRTEQVLARSEIDLAVEELAGDVEHLSDAVERWCLECVTEPRQPEHTPWRVAVAPLADLRSRPIPGTSARLVKLVQERLAEDGRWSVVDTADDLGATAALRGLADAMDPQRVDRLRDGLGLAHAVTGRLLDTPGGTALFLRITDLTTGRVLCQGSVPVVRR